MLTEVLTVYKCTICYGIVSKGRMRTLLFLIKNRKKNIPKTASMPPLWREKSGQTFLFSQDWEAIGAGSSGSSLLQYKMVATSFPSSGYGKDIFRWTGWAVIAWITAI